MVDQPTGPQELFLWTGTPLPHPVPPARHRRRRLPLSPARRRRPPLPPTHRHRRCPPLELLSAVAVGEAAGHHPLSPSSSPPPSLPFVPPRLRLQARMLPGEAARRLPSLYWPPEATMDTTAEHCHPQPSSPKPTPVPMPPAVSLFSVAPSSLTRPPKHRPKPPMPILSLPAILQAPVTARRPPWLPPPMHITIGPTATISIFPADHPPLPLVGHLHGRRRAHHRSAMSTTAAPSQATAAPLFLQAIHGRPSSITGHPSSSPSPQSTIATTTKAATILTAARRLPSTMRPKSTKQPAISLLPRLRQSPPAEPPPHHLPYLRRHAQAHARCHL